MIFLASLLALRVCADPNNMPFSNRALDGFENKIAAVLADELHEKVAYTWWAQRRGFLRHTVRAGLCDVVIGITPDAGPIATTAPYYRSTYVFVTRGTPITSFDDPRLRSLRVGIHVIGADYNGLPPAVALAKRHIIRNVVGYSIYGNYSDESPPSKLITAVAKDDVDVAIAWGPLAGYYARHASTPLVVTPVTTADALPGIPFVYDIAVGVNKDSTALRQRLDRALVARKADIQRILKRYGVPCV
ncbi:MAG TPA: substrate-binding domain-containing protein [Gemmatimonadaceae bacterium]|nr:substrate-binding domain-containing protein [Gemmatimonadaceae bacterium]